MTAATIRRLLCLHLMMWSAACWPAQNDAPQPKVSIGVPYSAKIGEPFNVDISIYPPVKKPVRVRFETNGAFSLPKGPLEIPPASPLPVTIKPLSANPDGIPWIQVFTDEYGEDHRWINLGFMGHVKASIMGKIPYGSWSTITLALVDKDGKPFSADVPLEVLVQSTDAALRMGAESGAIKISMLRNASFTNPFEIQPLSLKGGDIHLSTTLTSGNLPDYSLDTQYVTIAAEPAWWVPVVLAIGGGLLYGIYKVLNLAESATQRVRVAVTATIVTSAIAGLFGYLIASLDLLGLKLDPNSLRSYPLLGFLVAYMGVDPFVDRLAPKKR